MDIRVPVGRQLTKQYSGFASMHPWTNFIFLAAVIVITMFTMNPVILGISFAASLVYGIRLNGISFLKRNIIIAVWVIVFSVLIQPLFTHSGSTPLFYINDNPVSLENMIYGAVISLMLLSVIQWCGCVACILSSEKMMFLFGSFIPSVGMIFSMILRLIPLMRRRFRQIHEAQEGLRGSGNHNGFIEKNRHFIKEFSVLITWSLESSMETSMSMESRGYGLKGRTSFSRFRFTRRDTTAIIVIILLSACTASAVAMGTLTVYYLPMVYFTQINTRGVVGIITFAVLVMIPVVTDIYGSLVYNRRCAWNDDRMEDTQGGIVG